MRILQNILIGIAIILLTAIVAQSQTLSFVRTDVDSSRSKFITATYIFGFDIMAEDVAHCTNVTFELRYNQTKFVRFSEWKAGSFGPSTKAYILPLIDETNDAGRIVVSCGLDNSLDSTAPDNPKVIHLEFSVIPASPHFEAVNFSIYNPRATVVTDGVAEIIELSAEPIQYTIHSYVNVYPGDADNNGVVDHLDFATVSYYLGMGPNTKKMRSFKREPASTLWAPQAVIAWDTAAATYSDADGNGEVNMSDNLVVTYNYDKTHPMASKIPTVEKVMGFPSNPIARTENSIAVPIIAETWQTILALSGSINTNDFTDFNFIGIEPAGTFANDPEAFAFSNVQDNRIEFIVGTVDKSKPANLGGKIANLILEPKHFGNIISDPSLSNLKGITTFGQIVDIYAFTSITESSNSNDISLYYNDNLLTINNCLEDEISTIEIYSIDGELIAKNLMASSQRIATLYMPKLPIGVFFAKIIINGKFISRRFVVN